MCLPSPAVRDGGWVGKTVGSQGEVIGVFRDATSCKEIAGDSWLGCSIPNTYMGTPWVREVRVWREGQGGLHGSTRTG